MFDLSNQVAVVTGASSGLGVQLAKAFARQGADVAVLARRVEKLEAVAGEIRAMGRKALPLPCDVTKPEAVKQAVQTILGEFGKVEILLTAAGGNRDGAALTMTDDDWRKVIDLNLNAMFTCCREFGKEMVKRGYGRIINIASIYGLVGNAFAPCPAYHASKGGVINLTRALGAEYAKTGVTVNAIGPGFFDSELTHEYIDDPSFVSAVKAYCPMGRVGKAGELDAAAVYLASREASYTTGTTLFVDGGWTAI